MKIRFLKDFGILLIFGLSACNDKVSAGMNCSEQVSHPKCIEIFKEYETLRNSSILLNGNWKRFSAPEANRISEAFYTLSLTSRKSAPCISFGSKSYANYLRSVSDALTFKEPLEEIYVADAKQTLNNVMLDSCLWELGESSVILADQVLSNQFQPNNSNELKVFISKLNRSSVENNLACAIILGNVLLPYRDKDLIRQVRAECFHEHGKASAKMDEDQNQELMNIIKSEFSTLDRNISGNDRFFKEY